MTFTVTGQEYKLFTLIAAAGISNFTIWRLHSLFFNIFKHRWIVHTGTANNCDYTHYSHLVFSFFTISFLLKK